MNHTMDDSEQRTTAEAESSGRRPGRLVAAWNRGPLVLDAAMGTRLCARGLDLRSDDPCLWNLTHPAEVLDLHERDVSAGSQVVFTNTFGANRFWLANYDRADAVATINRRAVALCARRSDRMVSSPATLVRRRLRDPALRPNKRQP